MLWIYPDLGFGITMCLPESLFVVTQAFKLLLDLVHWLINRILLTSERDLVVASVTTKMVILTPNLDSKSQNTIREIPGRLISICLSEKKDYFFIWFRIKCVGK